MKLTDGTEAIPSFMDQATIALMRLSIDHLELLEQLAMELQARTNFTPPLPGAHKHLAERLVTPLMGMHAAAEYQADGSTESTWDH